MDGNKQSNISISSELVEFTMQIMFVVLIIVNCIFG